MKSIERAALAAFIDAADADGIARISNRELGERIHRKSRSAEYAVSGLIAQGHLEVIRYEEGPGRRLHRVVRVTDADA